MYLFSVMVPVASHHNTSSLNYRYFLGGFIPNISSIVTFPLFLSVWGIKVKFLSWFLYASLSHLDFTPLPSNLQGARFVSLSDDGGLMLGYL